MGRMGQLLGYMESRGQKKGEDRNTLKRLCDETVAEKI